MAGGWGGGGQVLHSCACVSGHVCVGVPISDDSRGMNGGGGGGSLFLLEAASFVCCKVGASQRGSSCNQSVQKWSAGNARLRFRVTERWKVIRHDGGIRSQALICPAGPGGTDTTSILPNVPGNMGKVACFGFFNSLWNCLMNVWDG